MNPVSFCANYKTNTSVISKNNKQPVSIVELDKENDMGLLCDLSELWGKKTGNNVEMLLSDFAKDIDEKPDVNAEHCIVLTLQKDNFDNLDPKKILGVSLFSEEDYENVINWFQVDPSNNFMFNPQKRKYKKVGEAILDYLTYEYDKKPIYVNSSNGAINFYKKYGFKSYDKNFPNYLYYEA